jgi:hypothetical protein
VWGSSVRVSGKILDKAGKILDYLRGTPLKHSGKILDKAGKTLDYCRGTPRESPADLQQKTVAHKKTLEEILGFYKINWCS